MKLVHLDALMIDAPVPDNCFYYYDGVVDNVYRHQIEIIKRYGIDEGRLSRKDRLLAHQSLYTLYGLYCRFNRGHSLHNGACITAVVWKELPDGYTLGEAYSHVCVLDNPSLEEVMFTRGHEETHYLLDTGNAGLLEDALKTIGIEENGLEVLPEEVAYNIGGFYSLRINMPQRRYKLARRIEDDEFCEWLRKHSNFLMS